MAKKDTSQVGTAHKAIRDSIIDYTLAPGSPVSDYQLAAQLGMSRAPVREAILLLAADGLVDYDENGKARVSGIGYADILDILSVRRALEGEAISTIAKNGWLSKTQLAELKRHTDEYTASADTEVILRNNRHDDGFHTALIRFSGNNRMLQIIEKMNTQMLRARWVNVAVPKRQQEIPAEHLVIYDALLRQNVADALAASKQHLDNSEKAYEQVLRDPLLRQAMDGIYSFLHKAP